MKSKKYFLLLIFSLASYLEASIVNHSHTIHLSNCDEIHDHYQNQVVKYPEHISLVTGQAEQFIAYELIARAIYQEFHPEYMDAEHLKKTLFLRYPCNDAPKNLQEFFDKFKLIEDFDTASSDVARHLLSFSPSLTEDDSDESALAIFRSNDRKQSYKSYITEIFKAEHIAQSVFKKPLKKLLEKFPKTAKGGVITQIFISKTAPLSKALYRSRPYGLPYNVAEDIHQFFEDYTSGKKWADDPVPQLRLLPSALIQENGFDNSDIYMVRYLLIDQKELQDYTDLVNRIAARIHKITRKQLQHIAQRRNEVLALQNQLERDAGLKELAALYIDHFDGCAALECINLMQDEFHKEPLMAYTVANILNSNEWQTAEQMLFNQRLPQHEKLMALLVQRYIEMGQIEKIKEIMPIFQPSPQKNMAVLLCASAFEDEEEFFNDQLSKEFPTDIKTLMKMNVLSIENPWSVN